MKTSTMLSCSRSLLLGGLLVLGQLGIFANESSLVCKTNSLLASVDSVADSGMSRLDSIAKVVVSPKSISVQIENDAVYPWKVNGNHAESGNSGVEKSTSSLKFSYSSEYPTEVSYYAWSKTNSYHSFKTYVDGDFKNNISTSKNFTRFYLPKGNHLVEFKDSISSLYYWGDQYGCLSDFCVKEILPLEEAVLSANSKPLTFTNDERYPWTIEDGYVQNTNYGNEKTSSRFSTTFTIDKPHKFSFETYVGDVDGWSGYGEYHNLKFYINDVSYQFFDNNNNFRSSKVLLDPGTYKMEWVDTLAYNYRDFRTKIKNIELSEIWIDVNVQTPGSLGVEVLKQVNVLTDVELLRVKGELNEVDWEKIGQMNQLVGLDLSQAKFKYIPKNGFSNLYWLSSVKLPVGVETIGTNSFVGTQIWHLDVPASVSSIGQEAFRECRALEKINFADGSQLKNIGYGAFYSCKKLKEFIMPNTVENLRTQYDREDYSSYTFYGCKALEKIVFSDKLRYLPHSTCDDCFSLTSVQLPSQLERIGNCCFDENRKLKKIDFPSSLNSLGYNAFAYSAIDSLRLPESLENIGEHAFSYSDSLRYIELPRYVYTYTNTFYDCDSVKKILCRAIVPPTIERDVLERGAYKKNITLIVPPLGLASYKLDPYWYQFGNIVATDEWSGDIVIGNQKYELHMPDEVPLDWKTNVILNNSQSRFTLNGNVPLSAGLYYMVEDYDADNRNNSRYNYCGSFINNGKMRADSVVVKTYFDDSEWTFMALPFCVNRLYTDSTTQYAVRTYSGSNRAAGDFTKTWENIQKWEDVSPYQGFIVHSDPANRDWSRFYFVAKDNEFKNNIFASIDVQVNLNEYVSEFAHNRSWNFIGNPYPCHYDTRAMDFTAPITVWDNYHRTYVAYSPVDDSYILRPFEAFFVQKPVDVDKITFSKEGRQHDREVRNDVSYVGAKCFANGGGEPRRVFNLTLTAANGQADRTRFVMNEAASRAYEMHCDANKFKSENKEASQLFTIENGVEFSINERPMDDGIVQLGVEIGKSGIYEIALSGFCDAQVILYDKKLNKKLNLSQGAYRFNAETGADIKRFEIHLGNDITGVEAVSAEQREDVIYDLQGRKVKVAPSKGVFIVNGQKVIK